MKRIVVLTGAGISAESGLKTFRDAGGLWEGHDVMRVASPEGWRADRDLVLEFYNARRKQLFEVHPNPAHKALVDLERHFRVSIITQNVDDLHERAGSSHVVHLHGELRKVRSSKNPMLVYDWEEDLRIGDLCEDGHQLRPHIVWFGEAVPMMDLAYGITSEADILLIIGSSLQVYPAASLVGAVARDTPVYYIDPKPSISHEVYQLRNLKIFDENASTGVVKVAQLLGEMA